MLANEIYEEYFLNSTLSIHNINIGGFISKYNGVEFASNCVFPLYEKDDPQIELKLSEIENFLLEKDISPLYRIVYQDNYKKLDSILFNKHYERISHNLALACSVAGKKNELFRFADFNESGISIFSWENAGDDFLEDYFYLREFNKKERYVFRNSMELCPLEKFVLVLAQENHLIGQAYFFRQANIIILKDIVIAKKYRGLGYSSKILYAILTYALKYGSELVITELPLDNEPAVNLFERNPMFIKLYDIFYRKYKPKTNERFRFN